MPYSDATDQPGMSSLAMITSSKPNSMVEPSSIVTVYVPVRSMVAISSCVNFAIAAARALKHHSSLTAEEIVVGEKIIERV